MKNKDDRGGDLLENIYLDTKKIKYIGEGVIIGKAVRIRRPEDVMIGDYTIIDDFCYISSALEIGRYCHIAPNVTISGGKGKLTMGNICSIAAGSSIHTGSSDYKGVSLDFPSIPLEFRFGGFSEDIVFDDHVLLGSHTVVLPGVHLPEGFASAALTVIKKREYESWTLYGGHRCEKIMTRDHKEYDECIKNLSLT